MARSGLCVSTAQCPELVCSCGTRRVNAEAAPVVDTASQRGEHAHRQGKGHRSQQEPADSDTLAPRQTSHGTQGAISVPVDCSRSSPEATTNSQPTQKAGRKKLAPARMQHSRPAWPTRGADLTPVRRQRRPGAAVGRPAELKETPPRIHPAQVTERKEGGFGHGSSSKAQFQFRRRTLVALAHRTRAVPPGTRHQTLNASPTSNRKSVSQRMAHRKAPARRHPRESSSSAPIAHPKGGCYGEGDQVSRPLGQPPTD